MDASWHISVVLLITKSFFDEDFAFKFDKIYCKDYSNV